MRNGNDSTRAPKSSDASHRLGDDNVAHSDAADVTPIADHDHPALGSIGEAHLLGLDKVPPPTPPNYRQWISLGLFVLMSIAMIATALVVTASSDKKVSILAAEQARLEQSAKGRSQVLRTWIDSRLLASRRITGSGLVRLFVSDMILNSVGSPLPRSLLDQRPYFQTLIADFAEQNDLVRAAVIDRQGRLLLSSSGPALNIMDILTRVSKKPDGWKSIMSPIRSIDKNSDTLVVDALIPLPKAQVANESTSKNAAILILTLPVNDILNDILTVTSPRAETEEVHLIQERNNDPEQISLAKLKFKTVKPFRNERLLPGQRLKFGRWSIADDQSYYSLGEPASDLGWTIVHSVKAHAALAPVNRFIIVATGIAFVVILIAAFFIAALWWHRASAHHHELISLYQSLAQRLSKQRSFLAAITTSVSDWLAVINEEEQYIYVNPAFAAALGRSEAEILGRHQNGVLPRRATTPAKDGFDGMVAGEQIDIVDLGDQHHFIATSSSDLRDQDGQSIGTVTVMRDQTELVEQRQRRIRAMTETIDAFVHAIERRDPFLLGHTHRLRRYAIAVGRKLTLEDDDLAGLALSASLSQIGKIFIPDKILIKPERHDQREAEVMRSHIDHALSILGRIDFGYPVVDILGQMHERLDGSGYPDGLVESDIDLPGRILGVTDVFCARTAPRSYRDRLSAGNALFHLANNASRYDLKVIAALAEVVAKEGELDTPDDLDAAFLDAQIWTNLHHHRPKMGTAA